MYLHWLLSLNNWHLVVKFTDWIQRKQVWQKIKTENEFWQIFYQFENELYSNQIQKIACLIFFLKPRVNTEQIFSFMLDKVPIYFTSWYYAMKMNALWYLYDHWQALLFECAGASLLTVELPVDSVQSRTRSHPVKS